MKSPQVFLYPFILSSCLRKGSREYRGKNVQDFLKPKTDLTFDTQEGFSWKN
jgi:hypothetical protein